MPENSWIQAAGAVNAAKAEKNHPLQADVIRLFGELRVPLLRYLHLLGLHGSEGEDVVQETFLALYRHLLEDRPRNSLQGWIFKVARNIALKRLQQAALSAGPAELPPIADPAPDPEQRAARAEQGRVIQNVIAALPDFDRQCLCLRAEGLRYRDIAAALDVALGSVALALSRALAKLARVAQK